MSNDMWRPHGFIVHEPMEALYLSAQVTMAPNGDVIDPKESHTTALWETLFNKIIFPEIGFICNSHFPPNPNSDQACDLVIRFATEEWAYQILCFIEAKRAKNSDDHRIKALEQQALDYCQDFLRAEPGLPSIYACTLVGTGIRCWRVDKGVSTLTAFWDDRFNGTYADYLDCGSDEHRVHIERVFNFMKTRPHSVMPPNLTSEGIGST